MKRLLHYFSPFEWALLIASEILIIGSFAWFGGTNYLTLAASLTGAASLILNAKGNPAGQALMILFSVLYGIISLGYRYYGEMITYLGMTLPMAVLSLIVWLKHPFAGSRSQVKINAIGGREWAALAGLTLAVTAAFYLILRALGTANLLPSTVSVATSFVAAYLTFRRSAWFSLAYAANDLVLIALWVLAAAEDAAYYSVIVCFITFLINDSYCWINWRKMQRRQAEASARPAQASDEQREKP